MLCTNYSTFLLALSCATAWVHKQHSLIFESRCYATAGGFPYPSQPGSLSSIVSAQGRLPDTDFRWVDREFLESHRLRFYFVFDGFVLPTYLVGISLISTGHRYRSQLVA